MALTLCLLAIVVAIVLGFKMNIHVGVSGMVFAFLIGVIGMNMKVNTIVGYWPTSMIFIMMVVTLFYGFAKQNGTIELLGKKMLQLMKGRSELLIPVTMLAGTVLGIAGATPSLIIGPLVYAIGLSAGQNPVMMAIVLCICYNLGCDNPWTGPGGIIQTGLIGEAGYQNYETMGMLVYFNAFVKNFLLCMIVYVFYKGFKGKKIEMEAPPELNPIQKKTTVLIVGSVLAMLIPPFLKLIWPNVAFFKTLSNVLCIQIVMPVVTLLAMVMKLGDMRSAVKNIPMNAIMLIGGMSMLMGVAKQAGLTETFAAMLGSNIPKFLIGPIFVLIAALLSFFSGGVSVVCPLLYPLAGSIAQTTGLNATFLFSCVFLGAMSSSCSPFSSGGAQTLSVVPDPELQQSMTMKMAGWAVAFPIIVAVLAGVGFFNIIPALFGGNAICY